MPGKWLDPMLLLLTALTLLVGGVAQLGQKPDWTSLCWAAGSLVMAVILLVEIAKRPFAQAQADRQALVDKLQTSLAHHEHEDEGALYPLLTRSMPGEDPMSAMSHAHREIFRLIHLLARMSRDFRSDPATTPADEIQYQLIRLDTIVQLHFEQEEELFRYLDWR